MIQDYGPRSEEIKRLIFVLGELTPEQISMIIMVAEDRGPGDRKYARRAALAADRELETRRASSHCATAVDYLQRRIGPAGHAVLHEAAGDAGIALATQDLIGFAWYGQSDFDRLIAPIREAIPEIIQSSEKGSA